MDTQYLKDIITVIRNEQERRSSLLEGKHPDFIYDQWVFTDVPFLNDLCLMLLVTLRHQVERKLVGMAARASNDGKEISRQQYEENRKYLRKNKDWDWKKIKSMLKLESNNNYEYLDILRHLSNAYKHDPSMKPGKELLEKLKLNTDINYAPLPESTYFRKGLAKFIGLGEESDYCDIAERFIEFANEYLSEIKKRVKLSKFKREFVNLNPDSCEH